MGLENKLELNLLANPIPINIIVRDYWKVYDSKDDYIQKSLLKFVVLQKKLYLNLLYSLKPNKMFKFRKLYSDKWPSTNN
jgi:hypothetical protein